MRNIVLPILVMVCFTGCSAIDASIRKYHQAAGRIQLGDSKDRVLKVLMPTQEKLPFAAMKPSDTYREGDDIMEIYYFRSGHQPDNLTTDDEFTPYVFKNGELIAIGWKTLGGPQSHGKVVPPAPITNIDHTIYIDND